MIKQLTLINFEEVKHNMNNRYSINQLRQMLSNNHYFNIGYFINNQLIGFVLTTLSDQIDIIWVYIHDKYLRQGYAFQLITHLSKKFNRPIMVEVDKNNFKAINLYQKLEFKLVSIRKNYYGHKRDALIMKLNKKCS